MSEAAGGSAPPMASLAPDGVPALAAAQPSGRSSHIGHDAGRHQQPRAPGREAGRVAMSLFELGGAGGGSDQIQGVAAAAALPPGDGTAADQRARAPQPVQCSQCEADLPKASFSNSQYRRARGHGDQPCK